MPLPTDFDAIYRDEADPWGQSGEEGKRAEYYWPARSALALSLRGYLSHSQYSALEIGCGHGHTMEHLRRVVGGNWTGMDISPVAVEQARAIWPDGQFVVGDIAGGAIGIPPNTRYDIVMWSQILWYVCCPWTRFREAMSNTFRLIAPGGLFVLHQAFLPEAEQEYCKPDFHGFDATLEQFLGWPNAQLLEARFDPVQRAGLFDGRIVLRKTG